MTGSTKVRGKRREVSVRRGNRGKMLPFRSRTSTQISLTFSVVALFAAWGCGEDGGGLGFDPEADASADVTEDGGELPDGGSGDPDGSGGNGGDGGGTPGGCTSADQCDDGISCTVDVCVNGACSHYAGPNSGETACPASQYCDTTKGCVAGVVCANDAQCEAKFGDDACKANIQCDSVNAVCVFSPLDKDGDGRVPLVCGGDDCNDADSAIYGGNSEVCDGKDNDCNGLIDDGATCPGAAVCQAGQCVCPAANQCGNECVDKSQDVNHCGGCFKACALGMSCDNGQCACPPTSTTCNGQCVDTKTSPQHCGGCNLVCPQGASCSNGQCFCPGGQTTCGNACVTTATNPNHCGGCNKKCQAGETCANSQCVKAPCTAPGLYILQDQSGSMGVQDQGTGTPTRWDAARNGLQDFMLQFASANINAGIGFFPAVSNTCFSSAYETPKVPIASLQTNATQITSQFPASLPNNVPASMATAAIDGAAKYVRTWATSNPTSKAAIVLILDGEPLSNCSGDTMATAATAAANAFAASPSVRTFVIGLGSDAANAATKWNQVAQSGGTGSAYFVTTAGQMTAALASIRDGLACP